MPCPPCNAFSRIFQLLININAATTIGDPAMSQLNIKIEKASTQTRRKYPKFQETRRIEGPKRIKVEEKGEDGHTRTVTHLTVETGASVTININ